MYVRSGNSKSDVTVDVTAVTFDVTVEKIDVMVNAGECTKPL